MKNIQLIKFIEGTEIIADVIEETITFVKFTNPIRVVIMPPRAANQNPSIGFAEWIPYVAEKEFIIDKTKILFIAKPVKELVEQHTNIYSPIKTPVAPSLILK